jgi:hypothetical protein
MEAMVMPYQFGIGLPSGGKEKRSNWAVGTGLEAATGNTASKNGCTGLTR